MKEVNRIIAAEATPISVSFPRSNGQFLFLVDRAGVRASKFSELQTQMELHHSSLSFGKREGTQSTVISRNGCFSQLDISMSHRGRRVAAYALWRSAVGAVNESGRVPTHSEMWGFATGKKIRAWPERRPKPMGELVRRRPRCHGRVIPVQQRSCVLDLAAR